MDEVHVEHGIGLLEDEQLETVEPYEALPHEVEQATRGRGQNVDPAGQALTCRSWPTPPHTTALLSLRDLP